MSSGEPVTAWLARLREELRGRAAPDGGPLDVERIAEELALHLDEAVADAEAEGLDPASAAARALERVGTPVVVARAWGVRGRAASGWRGRLTAGEVWMRGWARDLRQAARSLRRSPGYVAAVALTLALGIVYVNMVTSPHHLSAAMVDDRLHRMTEVFARLAPGATVESAREEVRVVTARLHAEHPEAYDPTQGYAVSATPLSEQLSQRARSTLLALAGVTALVLVIACANVANLVLARVLRRREELAVRAGLGATPRVLRRQLLAESLLPSLSGAALGSIVAWPAGGLLARFLSRYTARAAEIQMDARVVLVSLACGVGAAIAFAVLPRLPGSDPRTPGTPGGRATAGRAARRTQRLLVVAQVALCFAVLAGAGLLVRTLVHLQGDDGGLRLDDVLTVEVPLADRPAEERRRFYGSVLDRVQSLPGVRTAALGSRVPLRGEPSGLTAFVAGLEYELESRPTEPGAPIPRADFRPVSPEYFETLGLTLLQGRLFRRTDDETAAPVVVINRSLARDLFGDADPIGHRLGWRGDVLRFIGVSRDWRTVVGVVSDSADYGVGRAAPHLVYHPWAQEPAAHALFVRTPTPDATARAVVGVVRELAPEQPVENAATLAQIHSDAIAPQRLNAALVGSFALLALAISAVGIAGVLAFGVSERRRELGVRAALGADGGRLVRLVLAEGGLLAAAGLVVGGLLATALSRMVAGLLTGVAPGDPLTLAGVAALLMAVALAASWVPARRAARVDPVRALRAD